MPSIGRPPRDGSSGRRLYTNDGSGPVLRRLSAGAGRRTALGVGRARWRDVPHFRGGYELPVPTRPTRRRRDPRPNIRAPAAHQRRPHHVAQCTPCTPPRRARGHCTSPVRPQRAAPSARQHRRRGLRRPDVMIPARDGVQPAHQGLPPKDATRAAADHAAAHAVRHRRRRRATSTRATRTLADDGYIFVFQDIRGRFRSEGTFVMQRPPRAPGDTEGHRRGHRHLRHDRLAARRTCPATTAASACSAYRYDGWTTIMGAARAAPGAQGHLAAGLAGGHVAGRRLPPQRRVPPELRLRVRRDDGDGQETSSSSRSTATTPTTGT